MDVVVIFLLAGIYYLVNGMIYKGERSKEEFFFFFHPKI